MITTYKTLDELPALTNEQTRAAKPLTFVKESKIENGIDSKADFYVDPDENVDMFKWHGFDGAKYDFFVYASSTYYNYPAFQSFLREDLFAIKIFDDSGKAITKSSGNVDDLDNSSVELNGFVAPYTGNYYISLGGGAKAGVTFLDVTIGEDIDTSRQSTSNSVPTGDLVINGKNSQGEILSLKNTLTDKDGLGDFEYQWFRGDAEITDATAETYTISGDDVGKKISVKVSYLDGDGYLETAFSSLSSTAAAKSASIGNDLLIGTNGSDKINGLAGNDTLVGGLGDDNLTGGLGADVFKFNASNETGTTSKTRDIITDFKHSEGDKIDLSEIDANTKLVGDQALKFIGSKSFSGQAGELRFDSKTAILYGNVNNDKTPDFAIAMTGVKSLVVDDFVL